MLMLYHRASRIAVCKNLHNRVELGREREIIHLEYSQTVLRRQPTYWLS